MKNTLQLFLAALLLVCTTSQLRAQEKSIPGLVTAVEDGSPLPSVNVIVKGTTNGTTSCKDFVDINEDPNNPTVASLELLLPATQVSMAASMKDINLGASILIQQLYTGNTSRNFQDGTFYQQSWNGLYTQVLNDLEIIIKEGTTQQRWGYVTIAKLQKAYI